MNVQEREKFIDEMEKYLPPRRIGDPIDAHRWSENVARQTGRTYQLIKHLPVDGKCIIVIHKMFFGRHLKHMISEIRPDVDVNRIEFIAPRDEYELRHMLAGSRKPVFFDHVWFFQQNENLIKGINYDNTSHSEE